MDIAEIKKIVAADIINQAICSSGFTEGYLIGLIAEEDTCVGFLLAGIGECMKIGHENFLAINEKTRDNDILEFYNKLYERPDIAFILIEKHILKRIDKESMKFYNNYIPIILEIPSKSCPFKIEEDFFIERAMTLIKEDASENDQL